MATPLASPTLALLYLEQGHLQKARGVIDALLKLDPYHGPALALRERLGYRPRGQLRITLDRGSLCLRWSGIHRTPSPFLAIVASPREGARSTAPQGPDIIPLPGGVSGVYRIPCPAAPGSAVAAIGSPEDPERFIPRVISEPFDW